MKNNKISAFTLVELIVVITILAVLATVAFISFQGYTSSSRDSVRLADLKNVEKQLNIHFTQKNIYPEPSSPVSIPTGWTQWELWKSVTNQIWVSEVRDPLTQNYYFYRISQNKRKYQLMWFLENSDSITFSPLRSTFAENDIPYSKGDKLGIVLNSDGKTLPTTIDLSTGTYNVIFSNKTEENLTNVSWEDNFVELKAADKWVFDESLVWYWDMETMTADWKLADLSGNNNHGTIHDANNSGFATPVNGAMVFDGVDDYINVWKQESLWNPSMKELTIIAKFQSNTLNQQVIVRKSGFWNISWYMLEIWADYWQVRWAVIDNTSVNTNQKNHYHVPVWDSHNSVRVSAMVVDNLDISVYDFWRKVNSDFISNEYVFDNLESDFWIWALIRRNDTVWQFFEWKIDEILVFNRALSSSEVDDISSQLQ